MYSGVVYPGMFIIGTIGAFAVFHTFSVYDTVQRDSYLKNSPMQFKLSSSIRTVMYDKDLWLQLLVVFALTFIAPGAPIWGIKYVFVISNGIICRAIQFLIYCICCITAKICARKRWIKASLFSPLDMKETASTRPIYHRLGFIFALCMACAVIMPLLTPMWITTVNLTAEFPILILVAVIAALAGLFISRYGKAIASRHRFIKDLKKICIEKEFKISKIKNTYTSLFKSNAEFDFTIYNLKNTYDCKILPQFSKKYKTVLNENGVLLTKVPYPLFSKEMQYRYTFDSENKKILIFTVIPDVLLYNDGKQASHISSNTKIGEYRIITYSDFLTAISYDSFNK